MKKYIRASVDTHLVSLCDVLESNPVKTGIGYDEDSIIESIMQMDRYELEKLYMSVIRKVFTEIETRAAGSNPGIGANSPKYKANHRIRDVEKHIGNRSERELLDTLVQLVIEGYIVPTKKAASAKRVESSRRIRASKSFDPDREQLDLSEEGAYIIRELENEYGVKMPERGWGQVMDYIEDMVRNPSIYRSSGPAHDFRAMSMHLESVIYDIYEELTGVTVV